jgi:hypothetical protein
LAAAGIPRASSLSVGALGIEGGETAARNKGLAVPRPIGVVLLSVTAYAAPIYDLIPNMPAYRLAPLMAKYDAIIRALRVFQTLFAVL